MWLAKNNNQVALGLRKAIQIFGDDYNTKDGTCVRDYIHVEDLAQAHHQALRMLSNGHSAEVFNLGNGAGYSVKEIINAAREITGKPIPEIIVDRRPGDPAVLIASNQKAVTELGWNPQFPDLRSILETAWLWHKEHPKGYTSSEGTLF